MILFTHKTTEAIIGNIYISGPITGIENWQDNFIAAEKELLELQGAFFVINPLKISKTLEREFAQADKVPSYADYMRRDITRLVECDAICMLPGWQNSKGAKLEYEIAKALDMNVLEFKTE